jgi:6-pyruvoyltetrahydropterin/6-carboxytetrahydropterin synthase
MDRIRITKHFDFETAHALYGYDGKCKNIHGHSYHLHVTVIGTPIEDPDHPKNGMVMDFGDLKKIVREEIVLKFDHAVVLNANSPHRELAKTIEDHSHKIVMVPYQPTSEKMLFDFAERIRVRLPENVSLHSLKLYETSNSYAEWFADDQKD